VCIWRLHSVFELTIYRETASGHQETASCAQKLTSTSNTTVSQAILIQKQLYPGSTDIPLPSNNQHPGHKSTYFFCFICLTMASNGSTIVSTGPPQPLRAFSKTESSTRRAGSWTSFSNPRSTSSEAATDQVFKLYCWKGFTFGGGNWHQRGRLWPAPVLDSNRKVAKRVFRTE